MNQFFSAVRSKRPPGKGDVAVGAQQVVGRPVDRDAGELAVVVRIGRNGMNIEQIAKSQAARSTARAAR